MAPFVDPAVCNGAWVDGVNEVGVNIDPWRDPPGDPVVYHL